MWDYTDKVREHFINPKNSEAIQDANAIGEVGSITCGDALKLYLKISDAGIIENASFQTFGCASAIASSSVLTELIIGKSIEEASKITNKSISEQLGGLPKEKMHCSVMGQEALEAAIRNWKGEPAIPHSHEEGKMICKCFGITDAQIIRAIRENSLKTVEEITHYTKAGGGCGDCTTDIEEILAAELGKPVLTEIKLAPRKRLTNVQRMQLVSKAIDEEIRPRIEISGGDIELVDIDGNKVYITLKKCCAQFTSNQATIKELIEPVLREHVEPDIIVEEA